MSEIKALEELREYRDTPTRNEIVGKYADEIRELMGDAE